MSPAIRGLGIVAACGRGVDALRASLHCGWKPPVFVPVSGSHPLPCYPLPPGALDDKSLGRKVRRADRFSRMAVFAASDALDDACLSEGVDRGRIGLIVTSALGSHGTTFQFLDEILTYGDAEVSPTVFSHSVQNAAAAYIATTLDIRGPVMTLTQVHFAFHQALILAQTWLHSGRCDHVLVGGVDELGSVMQYIWRSLLPMSEDGQIHPFAFGKSPGTVPGEGAAFFLLSATGSNAYATFGSVETTHWSPPAHEPDLHLLEADGTLPDESAYALAAASGLQLAAYAPIFGSMPGGSALHCAVAALMLKEHIRFAVPVNDSPRDLPICRETTEWPMQSIQLTRMNCTGCAGRIQLSQ